MNTGLLCEGKQPHLFVDKYKCLRCNLDYKEFNSRMNQIKWDKRFIELSQFVSKWSKDPSTKVGAVLSRGKDVIQVGYNGLPEGIADNHEKLNNREIKLKIILHAEENILLRTNQNISGCQITTFPMSPCCKCASQLIQRGIKRVVSLKNKNPKWEDSINISKSLFKEAGVEYFEYDEEDFIKYEQYINNYAR